MIVLEVVFALKVNMYMYLQNMSKKFARRDSTKKRVFSLLCPACLPASLIMHVPISEIHAQ